MNRLQRAALHARWMVTAAAMGWIARVVERGTDADHAILAELLATLPPERRAALFARAARIVGKPS